jgi:hypothetical protein
MTRSWAYGAGLVLAMHLLWFALIVTEAHADWVMPAVIVLFFVTMNIAGLAAFVTAWQAPRHGLLLALSMAPLTALLATLFNLLLDVVGTHVDFSGFRGNLGLFAISLAYGIFVSAAGGGIGLWVARRRDSVPAAVAAIAVTVAPEAGSQT